MTVPIRVPQPEQGLDTRRAVQVVTFDEHDEPREFGSGYLIAADLVLTAEHVLRGAVTISVRFVGRDDTMPGVLVEEVAFADHTIDVAVLRLRHPEPPVHTVAFGYVAGKVDCETLGFPLFKLRDSASPGPYRESHHAFATIPPGSNVGEGTLELNLHNPLPALPDGTSWKGMSGAAVFAEGLLIGVVTKNEWREGSGRLTAQPAQSWHTLPPDRLAALSALTGFPGTGRLAPVGAAAATTASTRSWPLVLGEIPALASAFQPRLAVQNTLAEKAATSQTRVLSGGGGVGKTQLAAHHAHEAIKARTDLVLWTDASEVATVTAAYARAAALVQAPGATGQPEDAEADARSFLNWLATTEVSWLVVLDDVTDLGPAGPAWPRPVKENGQVLATTRQRGAGTSAAGRAQVNVDTFTGDEAEQFLRRRLAAADCLGLYDDQAGRLTEALGCLPLALGYAAAYLINRRCETGQYLDMFRQRTRSLEAVLPAWADAENYGRPVTTALLLSVEAADCEEPFGLASPALRIAAVLDPVGHPRALWSTSAVQRYLTDQTTQAATPISGDDALNALALLHRYHLVTDIGPALGQQTVRMHALTARAARETTAPSAVPWIYAADALRELWQDANRHLAAALRANTAVLIGIAGDHLWVRRQHPVVFIMGKSLIEAGLHTDALAYCERTAETCVRLLGPRHPDTLMALNSLAACYLHAERGADATEVLEQVYAESVAVRGPMDRETLLVRNNLAASYRATGRTEEALQVLSDVLTDCMNHYGPRDSLTMTARANFGVFLAVTGHPEEAVAVLEAALEDAEDEWGTDHPETIATREALADVYRSVERGDEADALRATILADSRRVHGPDHPVTLGALISLAESYHKAGRVQDAIEMLEGALADPRAVSDLWIVDVMRARTSLVACYETVGRRNEAIDVVQHIVDVVMARTPFAEDSVEMHDSLVKMQHQVGRHAEAVAAREAYLERVEQELGVGREFFLAASKLVVSYGLAGRQDEAVAQGEDVLKAAIEAFGPDHRLTAMTRLGVAESRQRRGRALLPHDAEAAWSDAEAAIRLADAADAAGPDAASPTLRGAYLLAAEALDLLGQSPLAEQFRLQASWLGEPAGE